MAETTDPTGWNGSAARFRFSSAFELSISTVEAESGIYEMVLEGKNTSYLVSTGTVTYAHGVPVCMDLVLEPLITSLDDPDPPRQIRVRTPRRAGQQP